MNRAQASMVLGKLAAMFRHTPDDLEAAVWYESVLARMDVELAMATAERIIDHDRYWPTAARFHEVRRSIEAESASTREVQAGPRTAQERANVASFQALCREVIDARDKRPHWHGGPEPCVVCGGLNPKVAAQQARAALRQARSEK